MRITLDYAQREGSDRLLLPDEKNVVAWLSEYGALHGEQIFRLLQKPRDAYEKIMRNLQQWSCIVELPGNYFGLDSLCVPNHKIISAVWALTHFAHRIEPTAHYALDYPSQLFFLSQNVGYEIVVIESEMELPKLRLLRPGEELRFVIVLFDETLAAKAILPNAPCLFALIGEYGADGVPLMSFGNNGLS